MGETGLVRFGQEWAGAPCDRINIAVNRVIAAAVHVGEDQSCWWLKLKIITCVRSNAIEFVVAIARCEHAAVELAIRAKQRHLHASNTQFCWLSNSIGSLILPDRAGYRRRVFYHTIPPR